VLHVLRVFCGADGSHGNPLGVFLDGAEVPEAERQEVARDLGFSETVFVDDLERGELRILTPRVELPLAGHPLVGTAWLLRENRTPAGTLRPPAGEVRVRFTDELTYISARAEWAPQFDFLELDAPAEVEALEGAPAGYGDVGVWAWLDRDAGKIRVRVFAPHEGIAEDEATGAAALRLVTRLGLELEIHQGRGSIIYGRPLGDGLAEVGGRVVLDEVRTYRAGVAS
jgi:predicted PhzF superfamily epimerase YddE/YHI9